MAFWDKLLGRSKPQQQRMRYRNYQGANTGRLFADFKYDSASADVELKVALPLLRSRSRDLVRNDPYAKRFMNLIKTNVIGETGLNLEVKARNADRSLDSVGNAIIEESWYDWGRVCSADGKMSWTDIQHYCVEAWKRDGEAFLQIVKGSIYKHGIALNPIEADLVDDQKNERLKNGNEIRMGVELDSYRRPVAYWIKQVHPGDYDFTTTSLHRTVRVPADQIIHFYEPTRAGQTRGEPALAPVMMSVKMLNGLREAELVASRLHASKMGIITSPAGDDFNADDYDNNVPILTAEPGTFHQLGPGQDIKMFDASHPSTAFADFQKGILRGIASGLGVSYSSLSNDLEGTSYSSIRQGALEERDNYRVMQMFVVRHLADKIYAAWLKHVMDFGFIPIPATKFDKFYNASIFRARGFSWVDPQREMQAAVIGLQNGLLAPSDIAAQYGRDTEELFSTWQRDKELAASYGLSLSFEPFGGAENQKGTANEPVPPEE